MPDPVNDLFLQFEALAIAACLRRHGEFDAADLVERWAERSYLDAQLLVDPSLN